MPGAHVAYVRAQSAHVHPAQALSQDLDRASAGAQITEGHWPVGTELSAETAPAKTLGFGCSTVREALRALAGAGLVRARQGPGVFVVATEPAEDWPTRARRAAVTHVYEVGRFVEVETASSPRGGVPRTTSPPSTRPWRAAPPPPRAGGPAHRPDGSSRPPGLPPGVSERGHDPRSRYTKLLSRKY